MRVNHGKLENWLLPAALVAAWAVLDGLGLLQHRALAGPGAVGWALWDGVFHGALLQDVLATLARTVLAVTLALGPATALGLWMGSTPRVANLWEPLVDFWRAVPPLLVLPVFVLAAGYGETARVGVAAWASAWTVMMLVAAGARRLHPQRDRYLRSLRAAWWQRLRWQWCYELLPHGLVALRQALATSLVVTVVTEMMLGAPHGLGARAVHAQIAYDTPQLYAVILLAGALGFAGAHAIQALERRFLTWEGG